MKKTDGGGITDMYDKERKAIVDYGKRLITEHLTSGTSGNISIFDPAAFNTETIRRYYEAWKVNRDQLNPSD